jgi:hypothetical protein
MEHRVSAIKIYFFVSTIRTSIKDSTKPRIKNRPKTYNATIYKKKRNSVVDPDLNPRRPK